MNVSGHSDYKVVESNYLTIGATVRFGNAMWQEVSGTLTTSTGDNTPTIVMRCRRKITKQDEGDGGVNEGT